MALINYVHSEQIHNLKAPRQIVPFLIKSIKPNNVLDVGCGTGTWLAVFEQNGIDDYLGIEGESFSPNQLHISSSKVLSKDLSKPFDLNRKFDLLICLEVAEHLPETSADTLVSSLVKHSDTILFSAAIPYQGGQNHINEQWPAYWQKKFEPHGFFFYDCIRPVIWANEDVEWWYKQNIFLVSKEKPKQDSNTIMALVHPELYYRNITHHLQYIEGLRDGKQGLRISARIFMKALAFKIKTLVGVA